MTTLKDHPVFPTLLRQFKADDRSMRDTAHHICAAGFTLDEVLWALAEHTPGMMTVHGGRGSAPVGFRPDYGLLYEKLAPTNSVSSTSFVALDWFGRTDDRCWTALTDVQLGKVTFARTFDFPDTVFSRLLNATVLDSETRCDVWRAAAGDSVMLPMVAHLTSTVGPMVSVPGESFRPFVVKTATIPDIRLLVHAMM